VRPVDFGGLRGVDGGGGDPVKGFWGPMIASLQGAGYQLGQDIYGAPYDWRLSPSDGLTQVRRLGLRCVLRHLKHSGIQVTMYSSSVCTENPTLIMGCTRAPRNNRPGPNRSYPITIKAT